MPGLQNSPRCIFVGGSIGTATPPTADSFVVYVGRRNSRGRPKMVLSCYRAKLCISTWTPSTRLSSSGTIHSCAASLSSLPGAGTARWSVLLRTRPESSACVPPCPRFAPCVSVLTPYSCPRIFLATGPFPDKSARYCRGTPTAGHPQHASSTRLFLARRKRRLPRASHARRGLCHSHCPATSAPHHWAGGISIVKQIHERLTLISASRNTFLLLS